MFKRKKGEACDTCSEHSGVEQRLSIGNLIFGLAVTVLITVFGVQTVALQSVGDDVAAIREDIASLKATVPLTQRTVEELQKRFYDHERAPGYGAQK